MTEDAERSQSNYPSGQGNSPKVDAGANRLLQLQTAALVELQMQTRLFWVALFSLNGGITTLTTGSPAQASIGLTVGAGLGAGLAWLLWRTSRGAREGWNQSGRRRFLPFSFRSR